MVTDLASPPPHEGSAPAAPSCPQLVAAFTAGIPPATRRQLGVARVAGLRAQGERGFILYRGAQDAGYFMPMAHENGQWKVAAIAGSPLP
jgi:hypothetical protein